MYTIISIIVIINLVGNIHCFNDLKNTGSIADVVRRDESRHASKVEEIDLFELCQVRCRLREHKDCNQETMDCNRECLNGFEVNSRGICQLSVQSQPENKEFMPTEELDKVWSTNDKKSVKQDEHPAADALEFTVSTRMTLQKVSHRQGQRHGDKLKQLGHLLSEEEAGIRDSSQTAAIDLSPARVNSPASTKDEEVEEEEQENDKASVVGGKSPNHAPHRAGGGASVRHMKSMSDIYFIGEVHDQKVPSTQDVVKVDEQQQEEEAEKRGDDPSHDLKQDVYKSATSDLGNPVSVNVKFYDRQWMFYIVLAGCVSAALFGIIITGICWYRLQRNMKATSDADYPSYGVSGAAKTTPPTADEINAMAGSPTSTGGATADRKLAQSAQMYHYQHQKQQMLNVEKAQSNFNKNQSDSEDENEDGDYTVYECPGLAPTGEMEVNNPLFGGHLETEQPGEDSAKTSAKPPSSPPSTTSPQHSK